MNSAITLLRTWSHVRDLHATILHLMGIDHHRFKFKFKGLDLGLTGVEQSNVVKKLLA